MGEGGRGVVVWDSTKVAIKAATKGWRVVVDRDADALAAEHEPDDAEFPILEAGDEGMRLVVEIMQWAGGDEVLAAPLARGKEERDAGDLLGQDVDGTVDPGELLVGAGEEGGGTRVGGGDGGEGEGRGWRMDGGGGTGAEELFEAEEVHGWGEFRD
jgi:hypothetical protein